MSSLAVMLDACVLIPAALRDVLLRSADAGLYRMYWSEDILEEVRRKLIGQLGKSEAQALRLVETLRTYFPEASVAGYEALIPAMTNDPKDRHVLAASVVSGSQVMSRATYKIFLLRPSRPIPLKLNLLTTFWFTFFSWTMSA